MKKYVKVSLLFLLFSGLVLADDNRTQEQTIDGNFTMLEPKSITSTPWYYLSASLSYMKMLRTIDTSETKVSSKIDDVANISLEAIILPEFLNITLNYSRNITPNIDTNMFNPFDYDDSAHHLSASIEPWYDERFGGVAVFYSLTQQNSSYTNETDSNISVRQYELLTPTTWGLKTISNATLTSKSSIQFKEQASYTGFKYLLPTFDILPKGLNVYYSIMDRTMLYYATYDAVDTLVYVDSAGYLYGIGYQRSLMELEENKLALHLVQVSKGAFQTFPAINLSEYTAGLTYKGSNWYVQAVALIYVSESYTGTIDNKNLVVPTQTDYFLSAYAGISF